MKLHHATFPILTWHHSDGSASPEEQTQQVLAIYPVLPGQKAGEVAALPSNDVAPPRSATQPVAQPPAQPGAQPSAGNDLIDFGGNDAAVQPPAQTPAQPPAQPAQPPVKPADDVENMLKQTGKPGEGSLIDL